ncbi:cytochrome P450 [Aspergillus heterothallicus]
MLVRERLFQAYGDLPWPFQDISPRTAILSAVLTFALYFLTASFYNVFLHPLRNVPGPLLAKIRYGDEVKCFNIYILWRIHKAFTATETFALKEAHDRYGRVIRTGPNELSFGSPTALRKIYTQGKGAPLKTGFYSEAIPFKEQHTFSMVDKRMHLGRKKLVSKCFSPAHLARFVQGVEQLSVHLNNLLAARTKETTDNVLDVYHVLNMFTFEAVYLLSFEEPLGMIESGNEHVLMHWMEETTASLIIAVLVPLARKTFYRMPGAWADKYRAVHKTKKYYAERMRERQKPGGSEFLHQLLNTPSDEHNRPLNDSEASEELIGLLFAGSETVGVSMTWLLWELARNPDVQEKLYEEIREVAPSLSSPVDHNAVVNLPYLKAVINETLRIHTAILGPFPRIAVEDMAIEGQAVPKGTVVTMCTYVTHRDPAYFPNPEVWDPERWISGDLETMKKAFAPFSVGPRTCVGQALAMTELTTLAPALVSMFY